MVALKQGFQTIIFYYRCTKKSHNIDIQVIQEGDEITLTLFLVNFGCILIPEMAYIFIHFVFDYKRKGFKIIY